MTPPPFAVFKTLLCLLTLLPGMLLAQDSTNSSSNSLREGMWALQFQVSSNLTLYSFLGSTLSVKHQSSHTGAERLGLDLRASYSTSSSSSPVSNHGDTTAQIYENSGVNESVGITVHFLKYSDVNEATHLYYGGGPMLTISTDRSTTQYSYLVGGSKLGYREGGGASGSWSAGASAVLGVEWFATQMLSLCGEYNVTGVYQQSHSGTDLRGSVNIYGNSVRFGLSAYF